MCQNGTAVWVNVCVCIIYCACAARTCVSLYMYVVCTVQCVHCVRHRLLSLATQTVEFSMAYTIFWWMACRQLFNFVWYVGSYSDSHGNDVGWLLWIATFHLVSTKVSWHFYDKHLAIVIKTQRLCDGWVLSLTCGLFGNLMPIAIDSECDAWQYHQVKLCSTSSFARSKFIVFVDGIACELRWSTIFSFAFRRRYLSSFQSWFYFCNFYCSLTPTMIPEHIGTLGLRVLHMRMSLFVTMHAMEFVHNSQLDRKFQRHTPLRHIFRFGRHKSLSQIIKCRKWMHWCPPFAGVTKTSTVETDCVCTNIHKSTINVRWLPSKLMFLTL